MIIEVHRIFFGIQLLARVVDSEKPNSSVNPTSYRGQVKGEGKITMNLIDDYAEMVTKERIVSSRKIEEIHGLRMGGIIYARRFEVFQPQKVNKLRGLRLIHGKA